MEQVAVVTGAGSGIGRAVAVDLLDSGWSVVLAGRRAERLAETAGLSQGRSLAVPTDVAEPEQVQALFAKVKATFNRVDLLFNNAGLSLAGNVGDLPLDKWRKVIDTNLTGAFLCAQEAFNIMREQDPMGGRIINNGSISAMTPRPNSPAYTASKHAMTGLTKSISLDGRKYNIACGQIDIGNAATEMGGRMAKGVPQPNGEVMPEPVFDVKHVAAAVHYMASLPLDANVQTMTVMATNMPFVGRG